MEWIADFPFPRLAARTLSRPNTILTIIQHSRKG